MPDPKSVWKEQPEEELAVTMEQILNRRTRDLAAGTRMEILLSVGAALFFVAVMAWRLPARTTLLEEAGFAAVLLWAASTVWLFRRRIWTPPAGPDALAGNSLDYYRAVLESRRNHLRNGWLWHGPLVFACLIFALSFRANGFTERLSGAAPMAVLLLAWTAFGIRRR